LLRNFDTTLYRNRRVFSYIHNIHTLRGSGVA
jgi:hypothetical protein